MEISLRVATEEDARDLLDIYAYYVKNTAITFEHEIPTLEEFICRILLMGYCFRMEQDMR